MLFRGCCSVLAVFTCCSVVLAFSPSLSSLGLPPPIRIGIKLSKETIFSTTGVIPDDIEMHTPPLHDGRYIYLHGVFGPLTLIISPCSSVINSTVYHVPQNSTGMLKDYLQVRPEYALASKRGREPLVYSWAEAPPGLYLLYVVAEQLQTVVALYATRSSSVPPALRIQQFPKVRVQPRLHRNRVTVRWDQSVVDPKLMHYWVVVNSRRNFSSLCEAQHSSDMNVFVLQPSKPTKLQNKIHKTEEDKNKKAVGQQLGNNDIFITCVEEGLSYTISNLQRGRDYFFDIFAQNRNTKVTFLYGSTALKYDPKLRPLGLRDNKPETVNIRKLGGRALLRYKVSGEHSDSEALHWHVMPCGGAVQAEVRLRRQVVVPRQTVEGYRQLQVSSPKPGHRYVLRLSVANPQQLRQLLEVEVLATTKPSVLPQLPPEATVYEYTSLRTCDSVTIGWVPALSQSVRYCVSATPVSFVESKSHFRPRPNQCNLDHRLHSQLDFAVKQCQDFSENDNRNVLVQRVTRLRAGKEYLIQVTVKKIKGKALSYDLLRVRTKIDCKGRTSEHLYL